jgi:hypothetical protein
MTARSARSARSPVPTGPGDGFAEIAAACVGWFTAVSAMAPATAKKKPRRLIPLFGRSIRSSPLCRTTIAGAGNRAAKSYSDINEILKNQKTGRVLPDGPV